MITLSKLLRGSCAIAASGALVLSNFSVAAQGQPPAETPLQPSTAVQQPPQPPTQRLGQAELEKLLAPIALYPDDLVAQILTASTYPIEVVQAARWANEHPNLHGNALQDAMQQQSWDASVKGLTSVPQVLAMMNDKLDWTQHLGEAFLVQGSDVSSAIQQLRARASANGNLKTSKELKVSTVVAPTPPSPGPPLGGDPALLPPPPPPEYITIEPADPGMYYVPIYDPTVVYGPWAWPTYTPFYWYPPGYVVGAAAIGFGVGFFVGAALWSHYNWGGGGVTINVNRYNQFNRTNLVATRGGFSNWQFNAVHRGTVGFQNATLRQQFGSTNPQGAQRGFQSTLQGNHTLTATPGAPPPLNAHTNANASVNRTSNASQNLNQGLNANRNASTNRSQGPNANFSHGASARVTGNAGPPRPGSNNKQHH